METASAIISGISTVLATLISVYLFSKFFQKQYVPLWNEREDYSGFSDKTWETFLTYSGMIAGVTSGLIYLLTFNPIMSYLIALLSFFLYFAAQTDYAIHRVPKEMSNFALIVGAICCVIAITGGERIYTQEYLIYDDPLKMTLFAGFAYQIAVGVLFIGLVLLPYFVGWADIKMFWVSGFFLSWYIGVVNMILIALICNVLLFIHMIGNNLGAKRRGQKKEPVPVLPSYAVAVTIGTVAALAGW